MTQFEIRPQEIYLLERYSSAEYFKELVEAFQNMLDAAERALDIFMSDLPYDYRDRHISEQPDVVWGELVLPNFRSTMDSLHYGYKELLEGDLSALQYAGNVTGAFRGQTADYLADWMDEVNYKQFKDWQNEASQFASNINGTVFGSWPVTFLTTEYDPEFFGELNLPESLPIYRLNPYIYINRRDSTDGWYLSSINRRSQCPVNA